MSLSPDITLLITHHNNNNETPNKQKLNQKQNNKQAKKFNTEKVDTMTDLTKTYVLYFKSFFFSEK